MAQTNFTPISLYYSSTAGNTPTAGNLVAGELAINTADGKLFYKDSAGVVQVIAGKGGAGVAGGSNTQVQYNSSGSLAGSANFTFNGTTVTIANDASISGLTVGKGGGSQLNTVVGYQAGQSNTTGNISVYVGYQAGATNTTGGENAAVGYKALFANTSGNYNNAFGGECLIANTTGGSNSAFGTNSLQSNTTGSSNTAVGNASLQANTTASNNTAVGYQALYTNSTGTSNVSVGNLALGQNTTGSYNTSVGAGIAGVTWGSLGSNTTGSYNTALGYQALLSNTTASNNTAVGYQAAYLNTTGTYNTFIGHQSGYFVTTGSKNTILGRYDGNGGGLDIRTASNYIVLSDGDGNPRGIFDNSGNFLVARTSNNTSAGITCASNGYFTTANAGTTNGTSSLDVYSTGASAYRFYVGMGGTIYATSTTISAISDQRLKENIRDLDVGLDAIMAVKPRRFDWKEGKGQDKKDAVGFIAQEFETVFPDSVTLSKAGGDGIEYKTVCHEELIPTLVKAIQELKAEVDSLKQQLGK